MDLGLKDRVVAITGGSRGLGAALAEVLVGEGARVAFCGRDQESLRAAEERLRGAGGDVLGVVADVGDREQLERFVGAAHARWGRLDGLVNNAGTAAGGTVMGNSDEYWRFDFESKVMAAVRATRCAVPLIAESGGGAIVNVSTIFGKAPGTATLPSSMSRAAGLSLTKSMANEFAGLGVRVNAVLIGLLRSHQWEVQASRAGTDLETFYTQLAQGASPIPLGRVGESRDFGDLAAFLLSERAQFITGTAVNLDGGLSPVV